MLAKELKKDQTEFKKDISKWLQSKDIEKSESEFIKFKEKYTKGSNISKEKADTITNYLDFYYERKQMIAKCYTKVDFSAGACSTQRAESLNAKVKKFIKVARRTTFLKLLDCFVFLNDAENFQKENTNRIMKSKQLQTEDPLFLALSKNYSPFIVSEIYSQIMK